MTFRETKARGRVLTYCDACKQRGGDISECFFPYSGGKGVTKGQWLDLCSACRQAASDLPQAFVSLQDTTPLLEAISQARGSAV